jgi:hypothetical protein
VVRSHLWAPLTPLLKTNLAQNYLDMALLTYEYRISNADFESF